MPEPLNICKSFLEVKVKIEMSTSSSFLEHSLWLEGVRGNRLEGCCLWCSKSFLIELDAVEANAEVRCWHCGLASEGLSLLAEANPGLTQELMSPAISELLNDIQKSLSRVFR